MWSVSSFSLHLFYLPLPPSLPSRLLKSTLRTSGMVSKFRDTHHIQHRHCVQSLPQSHEGLPEQQFPRSFGSSPPRPLHSRLRCSIILVGAMFAIAVMPYLTLVTLYLPSSIFSHRAPLDCGGGIRAGGKRQEVCLFEDRGEPPLVT